MRSRDALSHDRRLLIGALWRNEISESTLFFNKRSFFVFYAFYIMIRTRLSAHSVELGGSGDGRNAVARKKG